MRFQSPMRVGEKIASGHKLLVTVNLVLLLSRYCLRRPCWHSTAVKPHLTQNSECFSFLNYVSSSAVGWRRPISRLGGAPERHPDVMAPHHR